MIVALSGAEALYVSVKGNSRECFLEHAEANERLHGRVEVSSGDRQLVDISVRAEAAGLVRVRAAY